MATETLLVHRYRYRPSTAAVSPRARVLLMTATVEPPSGAVARIDPATRRADYMRALSRYLALPSETVDRIVFADNSASDMTAFIDLVEKAAPGKTVELLSFAANDHPVSYGKAYGEFRLIDTALALSDLIEPDDRVWKTTGRLYCENLPHLEQTSPARYAFVCDLFNVPFVRTGSWSQRTSMDLRLFAFRKSAYDEWLRGTWQGQGSKFNEVFVYRRIIAARASIEVMPRFAVQPRVAGVSGRTERSYEGRSQRTKDLIRSILRKVAPDLWL